MLAYKFILVFLVSLIFSACDAPRDRRAAYGNKSQVFNSTPTFSSGYAINSPANSSGSGSGAASEQAGSSPATPTTTPSNTIPSDASHCQWSADGITGFASDHALIGPYTLCKSSTTETNVYIQIKNPINDSYLCIIPTTNSNNLSTYVGEPRCLFATDPKKIYMVSLYKNRYGYGSYPITGAMLMKDKIYWYPAPYYQYLLAPDAYLQCAEFLATKGDSSYCYTFNMVNQHKYHQF